VSQRERFDSSLSAKEREPNDILGNSVNLLSPASVVWVILSTKLFELTKLRHQKTGHKVS
jgi:hypothetical protein